MNPWLYAALCVVVPVAWGLLIVALSNALEHVIVRHQDRQQPDASARETHQPESKRRTLPPIDYHI
jgi:hypothetical protein